MRKTAPIGLAAALAAAAFVAMPAAAQNGEAAGGLVETYQDWRLRCADPLGRTGCDIVQTISHRDSGVVLLSFSIAYAPDRDVHVTQILAPLGIDLRRGVDIAVGETAVAGVPVTRCEPAGCIIEAALAEDILAAMRSAMSGRITVYSDAENSASIEFSLAGFSEALDALHAAAEG